MESMFRLTGRSQSTRRGHLLSTLMIFIGIVSVLLGGVTKVAVSHNQAAVEDSRYASSLNYAEAGANYEMYRISQNPSSADQYPGTTYQMDRGSFRVYC